MRRIARNALSLLLTLTLLLGLTVPALAADTAAVMKLSRTEGTVTVTNASGRKMPLLDDMRLYNSYTVETGAASYAWINLDDTKLVKLSERTRVEVRKNGKKLDVLVIEGEIYGEVSKKLESDESLNVRTSTAIAGIRGTKYQMTAPPGDETDENLRELRDRYAGRFGMQDGGDLPEEELVFLGQEDGDGPSEAPGTVVFEGEVAVNSRKLFLESAGSVRVGAGQMLPQEGDTPKQASLSSISGSSQKELTKDGDYTLQTADGPVTITPEDAQQRLQEDEERSAEAAQQKAAQETADEGGANANPVWGSDSTDSSSGGSITGGSHSGGSGRPGGSKPPLERLYTVTFESNGGSAVASQTVSDGGRAAEPEEPTREGFRFDGWFTDTGLTQAWDFTAAVKADITLYAKWTAVGEEPEPPQTYAVTFESNGGSAVDAQTVSAGGCAEEPKDPIQDGFRFGGWFTDTALTVRWDFTAPVTADLTLYAKWRKLYQVTFDAKGGSAVYGQEVAEGDAAHEPDEPSYTGFLFGGWFTDADCTQAADFRKPITADTTFYAKWVDENNSVTVMFATNDDSPVQQVAVEKDTPVSRPTDPDKEGHTFDGWYVDATFSQKWDFGQPVSADMTLYGKWTVNTYAVTFENEGAIVDSLADIQHGSMVSAPTPPTREHETPSDAKWVFDGWYTEKNRGGKQWDFVNDPVTRDLTLYAGWYESFKITFNPSDADYTAESIPMWTNERGQIDSPPTLSRDKFELKGWKIASASVSDPTVDFRTKVFTGAETLNAKWEEIFTATFDFNGPADVESVTRTINANGGVDDVPTAEWKEGYRIVGWSTDKDGDSMVNNDSAQWYLTGDTTLYAQWNVKEMRLTGSGDLDTLKKYLGNAVFEVVLIQADGSNNEIAVTGGNLTDTPSMQIDRKLIVDSGVTLSIGQSTTVTGWLVVNEGGEVEIRVNGKATVTAKSQFTNMGTLTNNGTFTNEGDFSGTGVVAGSGMIDGANADSVTSGGGTNP